MNIRRSKSDHSNADSSNVCTHKPKANRLSNRIRHPWQFCCRFSKASFPSGSRVIGLGVIRLGVIGLGVIGLSAVASSSSQAQQSTTGTIVGIDNEGESCQLIVSAEGSNAPSTLAASADICSQALAGQRIQYTPQITQLTPLEPPASATIVNVSAGDRICTIQLQDDSGQLTNHYAGFDLCEQNLTGSQVSLTYETGNILDYTCQGDAGCGKSDAAQLIASIEVISSERPTRLPISRLPDGNYRYWSGPPQAIVTNNDIAENRGFIFRFQKRGNNITGVYGYYNDIALCVQGQVNDNTITGISVENNQGASIFSAGESFARVYPFSDTMRVRRGRRVNRNTVRYSSTLLDLSGLNQINAGTRIPPSRC